MSSRVLLAKIKEYAEYANKLRSLCMSMIETIKETFLPKTGMQKSSFLQDPGYVEAVNTCCMMHGMSQGIILIVFTIYVNTVNTVLNYIVYHSMKSSNYNLF